MRLLPPLSTSVDSDKNSVNVLLSLSEKKYEIDYKFSEKLVQFVSTKTYTSAVNLIRGTTSVIDDDEGEKCFIIIL